MFKFRINSITAEFSELTMLAVLSMYSIGLSDVQCIRFIRQQNPISLADAKEVVKYIINNFYIYDKNVVEKNANCTVQYLGKN